MSDIIQHEIMTPVKDRKQIWDPGVVELTHNYSDKIPQPESIMLVNKESLERISEVPSNYPVIKNTELYDRLLNTSKELGIDNPELSFGSYQKGRKIVFQLQVPSVDIRGEEIKRYLNSMNSFDRSSALGIAFKNHSTYCSNEFATMFGQAVKVRHIGDVEEKLNVYMNNFRLAYEQNEEETARYHELAETAWHPADNEMFVAKLLSYWDDENDCMIDLSESVKKKNKFDKVLNCVEQELEYRGNNLWGVHNGTTRYIRDKRSDNKNGLAYLFLNEGWRLSQKSLQLLDSF